MCYIKDEVMNKLTILVAYSFDLFYALVRNSIIKPIFAMDAIKKKENYIELIINTRRFLINTSFCRAGTNSENKIRIYIIN